MRNKRLAIFLIIFVFFAVVVVLTSTIFSLKSVEVKFLSSTNNLTGTETQIVESGKFRYGENLFFANKTGYVKKLEKENPYLRVINIESIFPNKFVINAVERNECYVIKLSNSGPTNNKYAVTDEYMKVLSILDVYQNNTSNAIEIKNSSLSSQQVSPGDFFETDDYFLNLFNSFREWKLSYADLKAKITSIEVDYEREDRLLINMRSGVQIVINKSSNQISDKLNLAFSFYDTKKDKNNNDVDYTKSGIILITETETSIYGVYQPVD